MSIKPLKLTRRRWIGLREAPGGGRPVRGTSGGRPPHGPSTFTSGAQLSAQSVRQA